MPPTRWRKEFDDRCIRLDTIPNSLFLHFDGHFPGGSGLAGTSNVSILDFVGAKDDGGGDGTV